MSQIMRVASRSATSPISKRTSTQISTRMKKRVGKRMITPKPANQHSRALIAGGAVIVGMLVAIPLTRRVIRRAHRRIDAHRDRRAGRVRGLDPLTSLPNRAEAQWWLNRRLGQARSRRQRLAVLVIDLDQFSECNETFGRSAGDHVLQVTAARLQALLRTGDMVCRIGNDTFMVIMDVTGPDHEVARIGERVVDAVADPISFGDETIMVTASVGFAISNDREAEPDLLLGRADRAVIQAKASQRPIVQF